MPHPHVFISYSHKDVHHRDALVAKLEEVGIAHWYDKYIEGGRDWRDEIDTALEEAFALVVIVTADAMKSHPVTYEWSWAIGNGLPVIALMFAEEVKIHHALARKQWITCYESIPQLLIDTLQSYIQVPPVTQLLGKSISDMVLPLRILQRVTLWLYPYSHPHHELSPYIDYDHFNRQIWPGKNGSQGLVQETMEEAHRLSNVVLPEFWFNHSHAFTRQQTAKFNKFSESRKLNKG